MSLLASNFALINVGILAFVAGGALVYLRTECPACGWTRREGRPGPFQYREEVSVEPTKQRFWAARVGGGDAVLHCTRTSALEDVIRRLVDAMKDKPTAAGATKKSEASQ
jgi:hypothetical protein